jgi:hypothetical protein
MPPSKRVRVSWVLRPGCSGSRDDQQLGVDGAQVEVGLGDRAARLSDTVSLA